MHPSEVELDLRSSSSALASQQSEENDEVEPDLMDESRSGNQSSSLLFPPEAIKSSCPNITDDDFIDENSTISHVPIDVNKFNAINSQYRKTMA